MSTAALPHSDQAVAPSGPAATTSGFQQISLGIIRLGFGWALFWSGIDKLFGLGFATTTGVHKTMVAGNNGDYFWGGAASTFFWTDPVEEMTVLFLTQLIPSSTWPVRRQLRSLIYSSVI